MAHSEHRDDKVLSVSTTPTGLPTFIDGPGSPTRSIHTEISSVSQVRHPDQGLRNVDFFNSAEDFERRQSVISNYPEGSTVGIKSPREMTFGFTNTNTPIDSQFGTPTKTSDYPEGSSIRALVPRSPRRPSIDSENKVTPNEHDTQSPVINEEEVAQFVTYPEGSFKRIKSPKSPTDTVTSTATTQTIDTFATASTSARTDRSPHVPFLPKILRITQNSHPASENPLLGSPQGFPKLRRSQPGYWRQGGEEPQRGIKRTGRHQELKEALAEGPPPRSQSFFDAISSEDEDDGDETVIFGAARTARVNRPQLVEHRSSRLIGKDALDDEADNPGPSRGKAARLLGTNIETLRALEGAPNDLAEELPGDGRLGLASAPLPVLHENEPAGTSVQNDPRLNFQNGLRSHPVQRAKTVPVRAKRKVRFPPPPLEEIRPEHRALRQSVVSTPYPIDGDGAHGMDVVVFLQLSGLHRGSRRIGSVVVPGRRKERAGNEKVESNASGRSKGRKSDFDDQKLFRLLRAEYRRRRGCFRVLAGARTLCCVRLRPDASSTGMDGRSDTAPVDDDFATSARLTRLFRSPKTGKAKHDCVDFITNTSIHGTVTFELVEDWSVTRIALAVVAVVLASLAAVLLWVFLGTGGGGQELRGFHEGGLGFRNAGGRVEAAVVVGVLVLLVGWTGVGAWVGLSWVG